MTINSFPFFVFFTIVMSLLWLSGKIIKKDQQYTVLFIWTLNLSSFLFTAYADWHFSICLFALSVFTYCMGLLIEMHSSFAKWLIRIGVIVPLLLLAVFKYFNFFATQFAHLLGNDYAALHFLLPLGISFYSFSSISYLVDIYRKKYQAAKSFSSFLLFMCFFPKLSSGPIIRFDQFSKQLTGLKRLHAENLSAGIQIFVIGMFKKMVLADHLNIFVNDVFYSPAAFSSFTILWAVVSYSLQIYFDFSGYSDMAIGCARILGFHFEKNFNFPYISGNLTEFWKRWHISLSSWLQEYLYYSLGGNRKGKFRTYVNLFLTMLLGGLWHGAAWTFIVWGGLHGIGLIVHKLFLNWKRQHENSHTFFKSKIWQLFSIIITFIYASICWIFFRADDLGNAMAVLAGMISVQSGITQIYSWTFLSLALLLPLTGFMLWKRKATIRDTQMNYPLLNLNSVGGLILFFTLCGLTIGLAYVGDTAFIYGAF